MSGKFHEMSCHHTLQGYLAEYVECACLAEIARGLLFQVIKLAPRSWSGAAHEASA